MMRQLHEGQGTGRGGEEATELLHALHYAEDATSVLLHMDLATSMLSHSRWAVPSTRPLGFFASASELSL